jgi:hypothetical protein
MLLALACASIVVAVVLAASKESGDECPARPSESIDRSNRAETVRRLVRCRQLIGLRRSQVRGLLGTADETGGAEWSYDAGVGADLAGDVRYLTVVFGPKGRVRTAEITE